MAGFWTSMGNNCYTYFMLLWLQKLGIFQYGSMVLIAFFLVSGAVSVAAPGDGVGAHPSECPAVSPYFPTDSYPSSDMENADAPDDKLDKVYDQWGVIKRPGVVMPVTTLFNAHTRETLPIFETPPVKPALLQHFFRCRGFGETIEMAPALLETLLSAAKHFESKTVTIISGYRSPKFNDTLAKKGRHVAMESRHMKGEAVDFRLDTVSASELGPWIRARFEGGVGTYRTDNFVHIDVGPRRSWEGH